MAFEDTEVVGQTPLLATAEDGLVPLHGRLLGQKNLVLDEATTAVGAFPIGHVIQQKVKGDMGLAVAVAIAPHGRPIFGHVDGAKAKVVGQRPSEHPHTRFGHKTKNRIGNGLAGAAQGLGGGGVGAFGQVVGAVDFPSAEATPAREHIHPADDVVGRVLVFGQIGQHGGHVRPCHRLHLQQARVDAGHLQGKREEHAQQARPADGGMKKVVVGGSATGFDLARGQE